MSSDKEQYQPVQDEAPKVDDMTDEQLEAIIRESINLSELIKRGSVQMAKIPLEEEVIKGMVDMVTQVWRAKEIKDLYPFAKEVDGPISRVYEVQLDTRYLEATRKRRKQSREAVDDLKSSVVEHLTPIRVPKLPPGLYSYPTTAMAVLVNKKKSESTIKATPLSKYL